MGFILSIIAIFIGFTLINPLIMFPGIIGLKFFFDKKTQVGSGLKGEREAVKLLSTLPDDYYIVNDITVKYEGRESQIDTVVVSPNGVSIVEVKNLNGHITGNLKDENWLQHKVGQKGTSYSNQFYSPVKQVGTHTYRLSKVLKENGINVWVNNGVLFTNAETTLDIRNNTDEEMHVYSYHYSDNLLEYLSREGNKKLSKEEIYKILAVLK